LVPGGHFAVASPVRKEIAYMKDKSIRVLNLDNNNDKIIYEIGSKEKVPDIHWSPDGKYVYLAYFNYHFGLSDLFTSGEKLIEVSTGREMSFAKIGHGFHPYTWR
jgi:hypothetical protein